MNTNCWYECEQLVDVGCFSRQEGITLSCIHMSIKGTTVLIDYHRVHHPHTLSMLHDKLKAACFDIKFSKVHSPYSNMSISVLLLYVLCVCI